jgi:predicted DNA-binding transcriptional regulator AlpA
MSDGCMQSPITVTVNEALRITGLGRTTLYKLIGQEKVKTILIGRRRLVIYDSLEALVANGGG